MVGDFWRPGSPPIALRDSGQAHDAHEIIEELPLPKAPAADEASARWLVFVDGLASNRAAPSSNIER